MKIRTVIGLATAILGAAFAIGFGTAPVSRAAASKPAAKAPRPLLMPKVATPTRQVGRPPLPTTRRFEPPPIPPEDPGVAEILNAPDEPPAEALASRWQGVDRRLDELFGAHFPAAKRTVLRTALASWIRDHARGIRAYYRGTIDQAELTDYVHGNMLAYARTVESALSRDEYRTFMDLEPGADPYITLVPPGSTVGGAMDKNPSADDEADE